MVSCFCARGSVSLDLCLVVVGCVTDAVCRRLLVLALAILWILDDVLGEFAHLEIEHSLLQLRVEQYKHLAEVLLDVDTLHLEERTYVVVGLGNARVFANRCKIPH